MTTTACLHPTTCRVRSHVVGTQAQRSCSAGARAGRPAPAAPPPPSAPDAQQGWVPGTAHPTGGYDAVESYVQETDSGPARYTEYTLHGVRHRTDGPAVIRAPRDEEATNALQEWHQHGVRHRGDGPAFVASSVSAYSYRGVRPEMHRRNERGDQLDHAIAHGARAENVVGWLCYPEHVVEALASEVDDPWDIREAWDAGVKDVPTLLAVARGELPASWATAGL